MSMAEVRDGAAARLEAVRKRIVEAAREAGRDPAEVTLIAVSKTFGPEAIEPVIAAGQTVFGENRVQEAKAKWPALRAQHPSVKLHLIGPLQSNKVRDAVELADAIHTIDRPKIARMIAEEQARTGRALELFVEVNTGDEPQKSGISPREAVSFVTQCREKFSLEINGLMCIPPLGETPALHFALLRKLAGEAGVKGLSMGMSADFEMAIAYGATHVRVGTAIFGERA
jgi:PLP dependent protein